MSHPKSGTPDGALTRVPCHISSQVLEPDRRDQRRRQDRNRRNVLPGRPSLEELDALAQDRDVQRPRIAVESVDEPVIERLPTINHEVPTGAWIRLEPAID